MALLIGAACGLAIYAMFAWRGLLHDTVAAGIILAAIATYWVVFAVMDGSWLSIAIQTSVAALFTVVAILAVPKLKIVMALAIVAHGVYDAFHVFFLDPIGPHWWPSFCGGLDVVLGGALLIHWLRGPQNELETQ